MVAGFAVFYVGFFVVGIVFEDGRRPLRMIKVGRGNGCHVLLAEGEGPEKKQSDPQRHQPAPVVFL